LILTKLPTQSLCIFYQIIFFQNKCVRNCPDPHDINESQQF